MAVLDETVPSSSEVEAMNKRRGRKRPKKNPPSTATEESELQNSMKGEEEEEEEEEGDAEVNVPEEKAKEEEKMKNKKRKTKTKKEGHEDTGDGKVEEGVEVQVEKDEEKKNQKKKVKTGGSGIMSTVSFDSLELSEKTLRAIKDMGFEHMTQVRFLLDQFISKFSLEFIVFNGSFIYLHCRRGKWEEVEFNFKPEVSK